MKVASFDASRDTHRRACASAVTSSVAWSDGYVERDVARRRVARGRVARRENGGERTERVDDARGASTSTGVRTSRARVVIGRDVARGREHATVVSGDRVGEWTGGKRGRAGARARGAGLRFSRGTRDADGTRD